MRHWTAFALRDSRLSRSSVKGPQRGGATQDASEHGGAGRLRKAVTAEGPGKDDWRRKSPRFQGAAFDDNPRLVRRIGQLAAAKECTPGQLALAWVLAQGDDVIPIQGTKKVRYLEENAAASGIVLTDEELAVLKNALPVGAAFGEGYAPDAMRVLNG